MYILLHVIQLSLAILFVTSCSSNWNCNFNCHAFAFTFTFTSHSYIHSPSYGLRYLRYAQLSSRSLNIGERATTSASASTSTGIIWSRMTKTTMSRLSIAPSSREQEMQKVEEQRKNGGRNRIESGRIRKANTKIETNIDTKRNTTSPNISNNTNTNNNERNINTICRIAASSDGKIPPILVRTDDQVGAEEAGDGAGTGTTSTSTSASITKTAEKIDAIYNAINNQHLKSLSIMDDIQNNATTIQTLIESLQNSGFVPLSQRDVDLCFALNPGYLLRLSIAPDLDQLDDELYHEFYSRNDNDNSTVFSTSTSTSAQASKLSSISLSSDSKALFDGRVLVFRRGYSEETTVGRLLLPKLDYLQYSLVQRSASKVARKIAKIDDMIAGKITNSSRLVQNSIQSTLDGWKEMIGYDEYGLEGSGGDGSNAMDPNLNSNSNGNGNVNPSKKFTNTATRIVKQPFEKGVNMLKNATSATGNSLDATLEEKTSFKLERYTIAGTGSRVTSRFRSKAAKGMANAVIDIDDALSPFLVCDIEGGDGDGDDDTTNNKSDIRTLAYNDDYYEDSNGVNTRTGNNSRGDDGNVVNGGTRSELQLSRPPIRLLKRISIANLVDFFSDGGRRRLIKSLFSESELVEPTFEEIVVIWRPLPKPVKTKKKLFTPPPVPKFVYDILEVFGAEHKLPKKAPSEPDPEPLPIEIRTFDRVPMANLLAVLPKTKLVFRPADALIFDLVNTFSLLVVLASQKFDSPKLDLIAIVSVSLWFLRSFFRYSNKIARYDLLVNKFLTQKISHRDIGALKYIANEAAVQRARRASLVHDWLVEDYGMDSGSTIDMNASESTSKSKIVSVEKKDIIEIGQFEINKRLPIDHPVYIDLHSALDDLVDLGLIHFSDEGRYLEEVKTGTSATQALARLWSEIFQII